METSSCCQYSMHKSIESIDSIKVIVYNRQQVSLEDTLGGVQGQLHPVEAGVGLGEWVGLAEGDGLNQELGIVATVALQFSAYTLTYWKP